MVDMDVAAYVGGAWRRRLRGLPHHEPGEAGVQEGRGDAVPEHGLGGSHNGGDCGSVARWGPNPCVDAREHGGGTGVKPVPVPRSRQNVLRSMVPAMQKE